MYWGYGYAPFWVGGGVISFFFWIIIIAICVRLLCWGLFGSRRYRRWGGTPPFGGPWGNWQQHSALDILKERYAKGEINKQEYEEKKRDLEL